MSEAKERIDESDLSALLCCPLCGDKKPRDKGFGIECRSCGLWLGDGTKANDNGGYLALWNRRAT